MQVLIYEPSYRRIAAAVDALSPRVEPVLMHEDGHFSRRALAVAPADFDLAACWLNSDLFGTPVIRDYAVTALKSPNLRWMQSGSAGFDNPIFAQMVKKGVRLTNSHAPAPAIAEFVLAGVLDHYQRGPVRRAAQAEAAWRPTGFREIAGTSWLIIGFGAIGQEVARRARAFGARITGVSRRAAAHPLADTVATPDAVPGLLADADVVLLSLPLSAESEGLVDAGFLGAMKPGSVLVNVGRGGHVDEAALLAALDAGTPGHAILDVFREEPLPADSRFWAHPKVAVTAHGAAHGSGLAARGDALFVENLRRFSDGEPLVNEVSAEEVLG